MERIYVTVRARPVSSDEAKSSQWQICGNAITYQNSPSYKFVFDRIFEDKCKTRDVYEARTKEIVAAAVQGFNGTVFAYGQTNSGKTHTMRGTCDEPGVIPLAVTELFNVIQKADGREFLLRMSYMEIYNEEINDLLAPEHRRLQIHESVERGVFVAGLSEEIVASPEHVLELMDRGESNRHIGETNMNLHSSRSHTIFRMIIESRERPEEGKLENSCDAVRVSNLNLVDLAGSERAAKTGAEGVRLKEGSHINKSLMTLGTVIKKLSEGAEGQGGHVPYRDSKLTRILQPALGGNANTAIICNITLAPIHADETKSSLQFASRALQVTNCAHVNEILTDAALLKRQKKEIEELRDKLQGSHSEDLEEEVLNLRNTLLQTELEKERITLELEEEKRSQVERDKQIEEQAKRIKNLSSMVLNANRDETQEHLKRNKRRDTWCPGKLDHGKSTDASMDSVVKNVREERAVGPLIQFEKLVEESEAAVDLSSKPNNILPDTCALSKVTSRRKVPFKKKDVSLDNHELIELKAEYEELQMQSEGQKIKFEVEVDCLKNIIIEGSMNMHQPATNSADNLKHICDRSTCFGDSGTANVITGLQKQIKELEWEKFLIQQNLDNAVKLNKEHNLSALQENQEDINLDSISELLSEVGLISEEVQSLRTLEETKSLIINDLFLSHSSTISFISKLRSSMYQNSMQLTELSNTHEKQKSYLESKITEFLDEKLVLENKSADFYKQVEELTTEIQKSEKALADLSEEHNLEKSELIDGIINLEREVSCLSSSSLSREKESLRKDLEKTRAKLKDCESKLKNVIQEKTRLEGEKANAEREIKKLSNQKAALERDKCKRESLACSRRESVADKRSRSQEDNILHILEEKQKLEVVAFEMEGTIASLEQELASVRQEKDDVAANNEILSFELEVLSEKLTNSDSDLSTLREEILGLRSELANSEESHQTLESKISRITEEKEELAMQMTHALLELEEERAIWYAKEKASTESVLEKTNRYDNEIITLSTELSMVTNEMTFLREEYKPLQQRLRDAVEDAELEKNHGKEKLQEIIQLKHDLDEFQQQSNKSELLLKEKVDKLQLDLSRAVDEVGRYKTEILALSKERDELQFQITEHEKTSNLSNESELLKEKVDKLQLDLSLAVDEVGRYRTEILALSKERDELQFQITEHENTSNLSNESQGLSSSIQQEELCCRKADGESQRECWSNDLLEAKLEAEELAKRCLYLETERHKERVIINKEKAKLSMRLRGTQAKLDAFRIRYREAVDEQEIMDRRFQEASTQLKRRLASIATENLDLKKQLASARVRYIEKPRDSHTVGIIKPAQVNEGTAAAQEENKGPSEEYGPVS